MVIDGQPWPIVSDFRTCLKTILAFEDPELTSYEKQIVLMTNLYLDMPDNVQDAAREAVLFLNGGRESEETDAPRLFSFAQDADLIFAAFRATHGVDLTVAQMHWWTFLALFMDLGQNTTFCQLVALRKRVKAGKATKEERAMAREMGAMFDVPEPDDRTLEEREAEALFNKLVEDGQRKREQANAT